MRTCLGLVCLALLAAALPAQVNVDCAPLGPLPTDPTLNCEGVSCNNPTGAFPGTAVTATASCGFPTFGPQYLLVGASGSTLIQLAAGGPMPRPLNPVITEVRIPIPAGATAITFSWEFFNAEGAGSSFNDGFSVDVVTSAGTLVGNLAYADASTALSACTAIAGSVEVAPAGPQTTTVALPAYAFCDYISIACWNEGDNAVSSRSYVDNITFDTAGGACPVPCFQPVAPLPALSITSPSGLGCLQINMVGLNVSGTFFFAVAFNPPPGWFFGINIDLQALADQINFGYPFTGPLSPDVGCTGGGGAAQIGEFCGLPSGLTFYSVALGLAGIGTGGPATIGEVTNTVAYTIP